MTRGIDVARFQGQPDWRAVRDSGVEFVYIKASEGSTGSYLTTDAHWHGANAVGLVSGLYHYAKPKLSPQANADALAAQVNRLGAGAGHLPPCLDLEEGTGYLGDWAAGFADRLRERTGLDRIMVFSTAAFFRSQISEAWMDDDMFLWIAHHGRPPGRPGYLSPRVVLHQHSTEGTVAGIHGNVDLNHAMRGIEEFIGKARPAKEEVDS